MTGPNPHNSLNALKTAPGPIAPDHASEPGKPGGFKRGAGMDGGNYEWRNTKAQREELRAKFDGCCAYCGSVLEKMHADHLEPCVRITTDAWSNPLDAPYMLKPERNNVENIMPACAPCNLHKGGYSLEGWRDILQRSAAICRRDTSTFKAGERFGIITVSERPIVFHFEKLRRDTMVRSKT